MLRHIDQHEGGVKVYTQALLPRLFRFGARHEFVVIYRDSKHIGTYGEWSNVKEVATSIPTSLLWDQVAVPRIARREKVDVIFNPKFTVPLFSRSKTVFVLHGSEWFVIPEAFEWLDRLYFSKSIPMYCRSSDAFVSVSATVGRDAVKHAGADPAKIVPVHNGFDHDIFNVIEDEALLQEIHAKYELPARYILWVGQMYPPKNLGRLFEAFARIKDDIPHDLVLGGQEAWRAKPELELIGRLGIRDRVRFTGWVSREHLPALYNLADLFVLPSLYEGFGIPLIEAMACGCPVLTSKTGSPPEVTEGAATLVDPRDVGDIAEGIRRVLSDPSFSRGLVDKGLRRAQDFSWDRCTKQVLELLENVANGRQLTGSLATLGDAVARG